MVPQFQLIRDATEAFGFLAIDKKGYEADDIIATLAKNATDEGAIVTIFSSDKDLMQLVSDDIKMYDPIKNIFIDIGAARGYYRRDNVAKSSVNIKNIKMSSRIVSN